MLDKVMTDSKYFVCSPPTATMTRGPRPGERQAALLSSRSGAFHSHSGGLTGNYAQGGFKPERVELGD